MRASGRRVKSAQVSGAAYSQAKWPVPSPSGSLSRLGEGQGEGADQDPSSGGDLKDLDNPLLPTFLAPLDDHQRRIFMEAFRRWRECGGSVAFAGLAVALEAQWDGRQAVFVWARGAGSGPRGPRFEVSFTALARKGVAADLLERWRDDLTTIAPAGANVDGTAFEAPVNQLFTSADAHKLVDNAVELLRRL